MKRRSSRSGTLKYFVMPVIGVIFLLIYVRSAGADVVYSDYIRIVADYLGDVGDLRSLFTPDILTRVPISYLARLINVSNFGYSVTFDRMLGIAGMTLMALVTAFYMRKYGIGLVAQAVVFVVLFSLSKWEILLNATAWVHLVSFGFFFLNYYLIDMLWRGETSAREEFLICLMPLLLLLTAGEYIASYALSMLLVSGLGAMMGGGSDNHLAHRTQSLFKAVFIMTAVSLSLYMLSRHFAVWEHAGTGDMSLPEVILTDPLYLPEFFVSGFASTVLGQEVAQDFTLGGAALPDWVLLTLGIVIICAYILAFYLYLRSDLYELTVFPFILMVSGFINHLLVTAARWNFMDISYSMSSRYSVQYMAGIIGILLVFRLYSRQIRALRRMDAATRSNIQAAVIAITVLIVAGNLYTSCREAFKARYREENYEYMAEVLLNHGDYSDEELAAVLEWHKDTETLEKAIGILESQDLNVFRQ